MSEATRCPVCDVMHGAPRWPSTRTVAWSDDCACSDAGLCVAHQYGHDDRTPERPPTPELSLRAEVEFERRRVEHAALLAKFAEYEALKAEVERLQDLFQRTHGVHHTWVDSRDKVAEYQRAKCLKAFSAWLREVHATGFPHETPEVLADAVDAGEFSVSLVTEGKP
jgi:hypothetical protein